MNACAEFMRDDEYSIGDTIMDVDQGGQAVGATAMPSAAQTGHVGAMRRRKVRVNKAFGRIYQHINDRRIREMLNALPEIRHAWSVERSGSKGNLSGKRDGVSATECCVVVRSAMGLAQRSLCMSVAIRHVAG